MEETPREPPLEPGEGIEHRDVTTPGSNPGPVQAPRRGGAPMWIWLFPLVLLVIFLVWYIFTRGEPSNPFEEIELEPPVVENPDTVIEDATIIQVPVATERPPEVDVQSGAQQPTPVAEAAPSGTPAPTAAPAPEEPAPSGN